jgi:branched-chain amino acid transport system substrate-binding protein
MLKRITPVIAGSALIAAALTVPARAEDKPILLGINTALQLQVGRDTLDGVRMAVEEINAKGGVLGRKLEVVTADEGESPKEGVAAVNKLTGDNNVNVLIGGYDSGVTLAELPHISRAQTIFLGTGSASPSIQQKVKDDYANYKYLFRVNPINSAKQAASLMDFIKGKLKGDLGYSKISILGENAKWVQDMVPYLKKNATEAGLEVPFAEFFDPQTADFSPIFAKVKDSGSQYLLIILSHAASDVFVKQWYDAKVPVPIGGIDVKSQDADFFKRVGGKAVSEVTTNFVLRKPITEKSIPWWDAFIKKYNRAPVYSAAGAYDAVYVYADAVTRAKTTDTDAVIKELEKTDYVSPRGRVKFDALHEVQDGPGNVNVIYVQWQADGERAVVWPKEVASGKMIDPPWMMKN